MCTHTEFKWEECGGENWDGDFISDMQRKEYSTTEDLDTHRYQCTQCKEVFYYSKVAKDYYEKGTPSIYFENP